MIELYKINSVTLEMDKLQIRIRMDYNQSLQMVKFTEMNELLVAGDAGYLTRVSFYPSKH